MGGQKVKWSWSVNYKLKLDMCHNFTVQSLYNISHCNTDLDITQ